VISACGNFTILGTEGGWIEKFNLQSGISRGSYIDTSLPLQCAHDGEVVGLACDATNGSLISAGYHGDIKVLPFLFHFCLVTLDSVGCLVDF
jgi:U3 small nucleolar RNA-associated protein 21